ncbi:MAG: chloride channel protein [Eubacteriaceae bacterium]|nr:chloride channel protein [Eubacteriaceae bacterium]
MQHASERIQIVNRVKMIGFCALLGAVAGAVVWLFLKAVAITSDLLWKTLPGVFPVLWLPVLICGLGGLAVGLLHQRFGVYPDSLDVVLGKIKGEKHYDYHPMFIMLLCAFLPLVIGASVGPEAGLAGIIAALCYWVGDNVKYAKHHAEAYSEVGTAVTLSVLFHAPLFGIFAVSESEDESNMALLSRTDKLMLYGAATAAGILIYSGLSKLFGAGLSGFPAFEGTVLSAADFGLMALGVPVGLVLYYIYTYAEKIFEMISGKIPVIVRETAAGVVIGLIAMVMPVLLFSGEEQMAEMIHAYGNYLPWMLFGVAVLKLVMTAFCLSFGLKGGHFFPMIFGCSAAGYALAMALFPDAGAHVVIAAAAVTATALGAQMKKPFATALLLLICFPFRYVLWLFLAALIAARLTGYSDRFLPMIGTES